MADHIDIKIQDKIDPSILGKINSIARHARAADSAVKQLQKSLSSITASSGIVRLQGALAKTATYQQKLATETQRTAARTAQAAIASDRAAMSAMRLQHAQDKVATATRNAGTQMTTFIRAAAGFAGVTLSAGAILSTADAYTVLQNKLQNVATSQGQVNLLTSQLFALSNRTRSGVEETTTAFARFDRALKLMGKSQADSLRMTETVNKALMVGGATATEASSALLQLSQAFNAGRLQGDEFRAVSENMPMVLDAIAKATGAPINQIKRMAFEGKITSQVLFDAFKVMETQVDAKFGKTTSTLSHHMTVLKNSAIQFFGQLNQSIGITAGLSKAILWLSDHMKHLVIATAAVSAAMMVAFGPAMLVAIMAATKAVLGFTVALASNPVGLMVVALSAAAASMALFGREINLGIDKVTTLGDFAAVAFQEIASVVQGLKSSVGQWFSTLWNEASSVLRRITTAVSGSTSSWMDSYSTFFKTTRTGWAAAVEGAAKTIDAISGLVSGMAIFVGRVMVEMIMMLQNAIGSAYNLLVGHIENMTNAAIGAANQLRALVGKSEFDLVNFERIGRVGGSKFEGIGQLWAESLQAGFKSQDGAMQKMLERGFDRASNRSRQRRSAGSAELRGAGQSQLAASPDAAAAKSAESRASAMEKINTQLDNEMSRLFLLQPLRESQAKLDQIEEGLLQKKMKLHRDERDAIMGKIQSIQYATTIQQKFDAVYQEAVGPQRDYLATLEASSRLMAMGAISQTQYGRAIAKATEEYKNAQDPMRQTNRDLQDQFRLLQLLPKQRQLEQQMIQLENEAIAKGIPNREKYLAQKREELTLLQTQQGLSQARDQLYQTFQQPREDFSNKQAAIKEMKQSGEQGAQDAQSSQLSDMTAMGINTEMFQSTLETQLNQYSEYQAKIEEMRAAGALQESEYANASLQLAIEKHNAQLNTASNFFGQLAQLQQSGNSRFAAIGKAAAIAQAMISTYQAAVSSYAAMASIPYVGPALGAAAAAAAIAAGLANVQQIRAQQTGFKAGGYTGNAGSNEVAGVVHGREYVMDAQSTSRIGVSNLAALQSGSANVQSSSGNKQPAAPQPAPINVNTPITAVVVQSKEAALAAMQSSEGKAFIIETIEENGGTVARMIGVK